MPPLAPPLREVLARRHALRRLDTNLGHHDGGQPVGDWRKTWSKACIAAGLCWVVGKTKKLSDLFHDLRRTVARNLIQSRAPERVAMTLTGHKADLRQATARLAEYVAAQPTTPTVVPLAKVTEGAGR